ncbi:carbon-phosphorus lyase complex subunit PhnI [Leptothoe sp. PORK10 BA2]|uniref:carbon-phosphorus lyase complex subunit PhnI n=1 Tax=Leptothoe sp. PORK10 BA2 TaxID=3110254 RepID=UPI002B2011A2|nr:carbon-phosphorus lyase complex subunit PhnI [Leptothoe sp. PORK10 BA2]MEA5465804.1 carbon-phosphorus lyase complex subunit PhnI [Leptothoe sp. PORK10 BA2]
MPYVAVKGGEQAIQNAEALLKAKRRGDLNVPELSLEQIKQQMQLAVNRVMAEGSLYDPDLAALAIKQSWGDLVEAAFLVRAYRTTLPRLYYSEPLDTGRIQLQRRISAVFKEAPGGQKLGPTFDYIHRLLDFNLAAENNQFKAPSHEAGSPNEWVPRVMALLQREGLMSVSSDLAPNDVSGKAPRPDHDLSATAIPTNAPLPFPGETRPSSSPSTPPFDITRQSLTTPTERDARLQTLARGDEGFLLSMAYSTQRGYGKNHPFAGEIRMGDVEMVICPEELGFEISIADITVTEVQMVNQFKGSKEMPPQFTKGYGLTFGYNERKAMAMALVDRALQAKDLGESVDGPAQDEEFVLYHSDNIEAQGFVQHLKLPHYIDFQAELNLIRKLRQDYDRAHGIQTSPAETVGTNGASAGDREHSPSSLQDKSPNALAHDVARGGMS